MHHIWKIEVLEDNLKNEDDIKIKDNNKNEQTTKNEDNHQNENVLATS